MVFLPLLLLGLGLSGPTPLASGQTKTIYQRVIERPDPNNGYEDYVRAADLLERSDVGVYLAWSPRQLDEWLENRKRAEEERKKPPPAGGDEELARLLKADSWGWSDRQEAQLPLVRQLHEMDYLGVQQAMVQRYGKVGDLVRLGNTKRVYDPRAGIDMSTLFPELSQFKTVVKVMAADAYVRFAAGDSRGGASTLMEILTFSRRIQSTTLINFLVGSACQAIALAVFEDSLSQLSRDDAVKIRGYVDAAMAEPNMYLAAIQGERQYARGTLDTLFRELDTKAPAGADEGDAAFVEPLRKFSPQERARAKAAAVLGIDEAYGEMIRRIGGSESQWYRATVEEDTPPPANPTAEDVGKALSQMFFGVMDQATVAALKARAQLRLLGMHARIIEYKWLNHKLPDKLADVLPADRIADPMSGEAFVYEKQERGYRLYSQGLKETGPIELRYRRPLDLGKDDKNIPPN